MPIMVPSFLEDGIDSTKPLSKVYAPFGKVNALLDQHLARSLLLKIPDQGGNVAAEYVWIGGSGEDLRSKTKTLDKKPMKVEEVPHWNFDGSSTNQAPGDDSEVYLIPRSLFRDPFRGGDNVIVMCDCYEPPKVSEDETPLPPEPIPSNTRYACASIMKQAEHEEPWFGIEQEYTLLNAETKWPLGWPLNGYPGPQGPYYCSAGTGYAIGRDIVEVHYKACLYAGVRVSGLNAEVMPAQWEFQVGPCEGVAMGDHLWMARYIMKRVCENFNVEVSFDPKPIPGDWNGAGGHVNYSTKTTRTPGVGWDEIQRQIEKLKKRHAVHIAHYGEGNERRLTGKHETSSIHDFKWGVADRGASVRVGRMVPVQKCGYYEDRRPASNLDPYVVTGLLVETTLLDSEE
eukprot:TRINITY_DN4878_c0_g2_i1.p1 TRINITY_DN4878_c0_g2~~TRINITY_DN4878_c0_g2_i1.p1  ORF type:complete len:400 (-),score=77.26 TRINITY_DN4878_c0_g2_i1:265-1464(-)